MQSRDLAVALFDDRDDAQDAINALRDAGFEASTISVVARDRDVQGTLAEDTGTHAGEAAATGAVAGGVLGGLAGWLVGIGALAIPGVGPIVAAGPLAAAIGGMAIGAAGGGIIGALTGAGIPEDEARYYDEGFRKGGILVTVRAPGRHGEAMEMMREYGGRNSSSTTATPYASWNEASPRLRTSYETQYGTGRRWEDVEPAHRFGYEAYGRSRNTDTGTATSYDTEEQRLREEWGRSGTNQSFDDYRNDVHRGWDFGRGRTRIRNYDRSTGTEGENTAAEVGGGATGALVGGAAGAAIGGPVGLVAGAAIGATGGAVAGDAAVETPRERSDADRKEVRDDERRRNR
jgi:hypothetical protein